MSNSQGALRTGRIKFLLVVGTVAVSLHATSAFADETKNLFGFVDWLNGVKEKICAPAAPGSPVKAPIAEVPKPVPPAAPVIPEESFKSPDQLRNYLECYSTEKGRYDQIKNEYMPIIESAAKEFEIPKTLLACLIMRESRFDIHAKSKTGAIGLGQHLKGTMKYITQLLKPMDESALKKNTETVNLTLEELVSKNKTTLEQAKKDQALARTRLTNRMHTLGWEAYYANLNKRKMHKGAVPRVVSPATIKDPQIAIGATAFYLKMILYDFRAALDQDLRVSNQDSQKPNYHVMLAAAGAYNMGPGAAIKILGPIEPPDREKWVDALAHSNEETAKHILSIQRCIESTASKRGNSWLGPIGSATYECLDGNESADPRIVIQPFNDLPDEYKSKFKTASMKATKQKPAKAAKSKKAEKPAAAPVPKTKKKGAK
jgi:hypothetical protein